MCEEFQHKGWRIIMNFKISKWNSLLFLTSVWDIRQEFFQDIQNPAFITVNLRSNVRTYVGARVRALNYTRVSANRTFFCSDERQWHRAMFRVFAGFIPPRGDAKIARRAKNGVVQLKTILGALSFRDRSHDCRRAVAHCVHAIYFFRIPHQPT